MTSSILDKAKVNAKRYVEIHLPRLIEKCKSLLPSGFIFQQDGAPAHTATLAQDCIASDCSEIIGKDEWPLTCLTLTLFIVAPYGVVKQ